jgi:hypothetical protein
MPVEEWAERVIPMIGERDQGVAMTVTSLITTMAQDNLEVFAGCYQQAVDRLDKVSYLELCELTARLSLTPRPPPRMFTTKCPTRGSRSSSSACCSTTLRQVSWLGRVAAVTNIRQSRGH